MKNSAKNKTSRKKSTKSKSTGNKSTKKTGTAKKHKRKRSSWYKRFKKRRKKRSGNAGNARRRLWVDRIGRFIVLAAVLAALLFVAGVFWKGLNRYLGMNNTPVELTSQSSGHDLLQAEDKPCGRPEIRQDFLTPNEYSRSQIPIKKIRGIVIHYVANPGSSAIDNRDYFEDLKDTHETKASSHFIIGLSGEIIQCIPLDEISYASNDRNMDTISIECCHPGKDGKFNEETRKSLVKLTAWLCVTYGIRMKNVIRHYDVTGKMCPIYYVKHEDAWIALKEDIMKIIYGQSGKND